jgi:hypothetical protein
VLIDVTAPREVVVDQIWSAVNSRFAPLGDARMQEHAAP